MAQLEEEACWATGLDIATTGLARSERQELQAVIETAGGRRAPTDPPSARHMHSMHSTAPAHID